MKLHWPHEANWDAPLFAEYTNDTIQIMTAMKLAKLQVLCARGEKRARAVDELRRRAFSLYNGGVPYIDGKYEFLHLVRELGCDAPAGVLVEPGQVATALPKQNTSFLLACS